jgi:hypothetical protein
MATMEEDRQWVSLLASVYDGNLPIYEFIRFLESLPIKLLVNGGSVRARFLSDVKGSGLTAAASGRLGLRILPRTPGRPDRIASRSLREWWPVRGVVVNLCVWSRFFSGPPLYGRNLAVFDDLDRTLAADMMLGTKLLLQLVRHDPGFRGYLLHEYRRSRGGFSLCRLLLRASTFVVLLTFLFPTFVGLMA